MAKKPQTTPDSSDPRELSDPRKFKKYYYRLVFNRNKEAYEDFVAFYDKAKDDGYMYCASIAWIDFNKRWAQDESGQWIRIT